MGKEDENWKTISEITSKLIHHRQIEEEEVLELIYDRLREILHRPEKALVKLGIDAIELATLIDDDMHDLGKIDRVHHWMIGTVGLLATLKGLEIAITRLRKKIDSD